MPVFPPGVPRYEIEAPKTLADKGKPGSSVLNDAHRIFALIDDERHLSAHDLYTDVKRRLDESAAATAEAAAAAGDKKKEEAPSSPTRHRSPLSKFKPLLPALQKGKKGLPELSREKKEVQEAKEYLQSRQAEIYKLEQRNRLFREAQQNLNVEEDWTLASTLFGVNTSYRREEDGSLSLKLEGELKDVPLFEQVCVLKEVDLHYKWAPFCSSSMTVADLGKLDTIGWVLIGMPNFGIARDGCFRAIGCDNIAEDGTFILFGQGINDRKPDEPAPDDTHLSEDPILDRLDIPPIPTRRGSGRMTIRKFQGLVHVLSPTEARTKVVANIDPNLAFLPQSLLEFVMKHLAGALLAKLQGAAKRVPKNPVHNDHAKKMRDEEDFYKRWLMPKFQTVCREKGWTMPAVTAFELTEEQLLKEHREAEKRPRRAVSFDGEGAGGIVENMEVTAVKSDPSSPNADGTEESVSELSARTTLTAIWRNNPIAAYLREIEERTQKRKAAQIAETRRRATDRLKPGLLSFEQEERLSELKLAKAKRLAAQHLHGTVPSSSNHHPPRRGQIPHSDSTRQWSQQMAGRLHVHDRPTRFFVVTILVALLFALLHPSTWFEPFKPAPEYPWWRYMLDDAGTVLYILLCSISHFVLCDVALVYAFGSLELGMKSGQKIKRFYSDNVRIVVAALSLAMVSMSITKAIARVWIGAVVRLTLRGFASVAGVVCDVWTRWLSTVNDLWSAAPAPVVEAWRAVLLFYDMGVFAVLVVYELFLAFPARLVRDYLIRSNFVGRYAEYLFVGSFNLVVGVFMGIFGLIRQVIGGFDYGSEMVSWRNEAFETSRTLFSYTAVFLLTTLILFNLSARTFRNDSDRSSSGRRGGGAPSDAPRSPSTVSSMSESSDPDKAAASGAAANARASPNGAMTQDKPASERSLSSQGSKKSSSTTSSFRIRRRLRFRGKVTQSTPNSMMGGGSGSSGSSSSRLGRKYRKSNTTV